MQERQQERIGKMKGVIACGIKKGSDLPSLLRQLRCRAAPDAGLAEEDELLGQRGLRPTKAIHEVLLGEHQRIWLGCHGNIEGRGNGIGLEFMGFAHVNQKGRVGRGFEDGEDLVSEI